MPRREKMKHLIAASLLCVFVSGFIGYNVGYFNGYRANEPAAIGIKVLFDHAQAGDIIRYCLVGTGKNNVRVECPEEK
jgi:hypothetical protein